MPSAHLEKVFDPIQLRRIALQTELLRLQRQADIVVARGLSGTIVAAAMSTLFGTPFAIVRKLEETSHGRSLEVIDTDDNFRTIRYSNWVIVDDLISSGATVQAIMDRIARHPDIFQGECTGIILYHNTNTIEDTYSIDDGRTFPLFYIGSVEDV